MNDSQRLKPLPTTQSCSGLGGSRSVQLYWPHIITHVSNLLTPSDLLSFLLVRCYMGNELLHNDQHGTPLPKVRKIFQAMSLIVCLLSQFRHQAYIRVSLACLPPSQLSIRGSWQRNDATRAEANTCLITMPFNFPRIRDRLPNRATQHPSRLSPASPSLSTKCTRRAGSAMLSANHSHRVYAEALCYRRWRACLSV
jgi:hypothetical protein